MRLFLVRHACSEGNEKGLVTATPKDALSERGLDQARSLGEWINELNIDFDVYFVSHWLRASQTAGFIADPKVWNQDRRLGETDAGDVSNLVRSDFLKIQPKFYHSNDNTYPNGESHNQLNDRVISWLQSVATNYQNKNVLVVTHSGPISCIIQHVFSMDMEKFPLFLQGNATLSVIDIQNNVNNLSGTIRLFSSGPCDNLISYLS